MAARECKIAAAINLVGRQQSWWAGDSTWTRTYSRFTPQLETYATLVFETTEEPQQLCVVEVSVDRFRGPSATVAHVHVEEIGWLWLMPYTGDPGLPTLSAVVQRCAATRVLRYRPYKRCTVRATSGADVQIAKVFPDRRGEVMYRDGLALWNARLRGELECNVARPVCWDDPSNTLWQEVVPGEAVMSRLYRAGGVALAEKMGRACATIARSSVEPSRVVDRNKQFERARRHAALLTRTIPTSTEPVRKLMACLAALQNNRRHERLRPIHGAPRTQQWLYDGESLGPVDFDRFCYGEPEVDAATFVAEVEFQDPRRVPVKDLTGAFLEGYQSLAGSLDPMRSRGYRAGQYLSKAAKAARTPAMKAPSKATKLLQRALAVAEGLAR
ncbi:MAG: phosphotransferase [Gammaproteobacteria bacterium]